MGRDGKVGLGRRGCGNKNKSRCDDG